MQEKEIRGISVKYDGDLLTRVVVKPFAEIEHRIPFIKLDDVYIYFPYDGDIIISKEDINSF